MLRISIRELLILTAGAGLVVTWYLDHRAAAARYAALAERHSAVVEHAETLRVTLVNAKQANDDLKKTFDAWMSTPTRPNGYSLLYPHVEWSIAEVPVDPDNPSTLWRSQN